VVSAPVPTPPLLALDRVAFAYRERAALVGVTLALRPGRVLGLVGPNGSGKSTLVRLAAGLLRPQDGAVRLEGVDLGQLRRGQVARRIAVVPQGAVLPPAFTGWEVALAGRTPHLRPLAQPGARDEAVARRALALVDALPLAGRRVGELSGGERQRLVLARALAQEPDVLLLDEPTAHLDLPHQVALLGLVRRFAREDGLAVLGVFHDLNLAAEYCDDVALLEEGRLVALGPPAEVLSVEAIEAVYGLTVPVVRHPESGRPAILPPAADHRRDPPAPGVDVGESAAQERPAANRERTPA
jgi:iron complex transport system ATP-binding protein